MNWTGLFQLVGGRWPMEEEGSAQRVQMAIRATGAAVVLAAAYGIAAGSTDLLLAAGNAWKVPMVVVLSGLTALPAGLLAFKVLGGEKGASQLVVSAAAGNFAATLVLAALSPLVALYYNSSTFWGAPLAMTSCALAVAVGLFSAGRLMRRMPHAIKMTVPFAVLAAVQLLALLQYTHLASPILPEQTVFDHGADALLGL
jgi:hypothetical protein